MMLTEEWADVEVSHGKYSVSSLGRVRRNELDFTDSMGRKYLLPSRELKPHDRWDGYVDVALSVGGDVLFFSIHRLVAMAFIKNDSNLPCVDHIDGDKKNNCVYNLRWCTHKEDSNFELAKQNYKKCSDKKKKAVVKSDSYGNVIEVYESATEAAIKNNTFQSEISRACMGIRKNKLGFNWSFK